ncbi:MAG: hypothetical protein MI919_32925, partial [Holophagales bacterium]|nr:hypothetical protein [Holophagales bacterium]
MVESWPVAVGVVLPRESLQRLEHAHLTENGVPIPHDAEITGYWPPDQSWIKWVLLRFRATTDRDYRLVLAAGPPRAPGPPLATETKTQITIDTGPLEVVISKNAPDLLESVELGGIPQLWGNEAASHSMTVVDDLPDGGGPPISGPATFEDVVTVVEANTDLWAAVKKTGIYRWGGRDIARLDLRYELFEGETFVRLYHTVTWLERTEPLPFPNPMCDFPVEDLSIRASDVALTFPFVDYSRAQEQTSFRVGFEPPVNEETFELIFDAEGKVVQAAPGSSTAPHVRGTYPNLAGWFSVVVDGGGRESAVVVRDLWQTYPKMVTARLEALRLSLWSDSTGAAVGDAHRGLSFEVRDILPEAAWWWWRQDYDASVPLAARSSRWGDQEYVTDFFTCTGLPLPHHFVHEWYSIHVFEHTGQ